MGSSASRGTKREAKIAEKEAIAELCQEYVALMKEGGLDNFELSKSQIKTITMIYKRIVIKDLKELIRSAVVHSNQQFIKLHVDGDFRSLTERHFNILISYILKQKFHFVNEMTIDCQLKNKYYEYYEETTRYITHIRHYNDIILSWDHINIKTEDVIECRNHVKDGHSLRWVNCETIEDMIIYGRFVQLRKNKTEKRKSSYAKRWELK